MSRVSVKIIAGCLLVVALIGGGLAFGLYFRTDEKASLQHREHRAVADRQFVQKEWTDSRRNYETLVEADPFDGAALRGLADSLSNSRREIWSELKELKQTQPEDGDRSALDSYYQREKKISQQAIKHFERLLDFARYRDHALERLAALHSCLSRMDGGQEHADIAIGYLKTLVDEGASTDYGIRNMAEFKFIAEHPDFDKLAKLEFSLDRDGQFRRGGLQGRRYERWNLFGDGR